MFMELDFVELVVVAGLVRVQEHRRFARSLATPATLGPFAKRHFEFKFFTITANF